MAQRKQNERSASEQARFDEDGYECPGPHADVIFELESAPEPRRRLKFWTKTGRTGASRG